ncbi:MAG TPA: SRPBCC family protein [Marmoricola sp.]|nr:SRPBCC family protein [Marmoricola sp.]
MSADRELRAETTINAPVGEVWAAITDVSRMPEWSDETVKMLPLKSGGLRLNQWYLGINRRKAVFWPTRSVVSALEPESKLAWLTKSSGAEWIYELAPEGDGTRIVHRRPVPHGITLMSNVFAPLALGGSERHADELEVSMGRTLERIKAAVEN